MKIVKNACYGGYSLSPLAVKRLAELKGKECYFFTGGIGSDYKPIALKDLEHSLFWLAFSIPNPNEVLTKESRDNIRKFNKAYEKISLDSRPEDRTDKDLIKVIEELGDKANGACAKLKIVEIPDGIEYEIDEYDGIETIREKHRTW